MGRTVLLAGEMHVIRSHHLRSRLGRKLEYAFIGYKLTLIYFL